MKTFYVTLLGCLMSFAGFAQEEVSKETIQKQMITVGIEHNERLEAVFHQLQANPAALRQAPTVDERIKYLSGLINSTPPYNPGPGAINEAIHAEAQQNSNNNLKAALNSKGTKTYSQAVLESLRLSPKEAHYYNTLNEIIERNEKNRPLLISELDNFINQVIAFFGPKSNFCLGLVAGAEVAKASAQYWEENHEKWTELANTIGGGSVSGRNEACCKGILKADASGAISGGLTGAMVGAAAGGVGALPGAGTGAVTGAVTGSTTAAITSFVSWLFD